MDKFIYLSSSWIKVRWWSAWSCWEFRENTLVKLRVKGYFGRNNKRVYWIFWIGISWKMRYY